MERYIHDNQTYDLCSECNQPNTWCNCTMERYMHDNKTYYGLCSECNQPNTFDYWCKKCYSKKYNWTSENKQIDKFIQDAQLNAKIRTEMLYLNSRYSPYSI